MAGFSGLTFAAPTVGAAAVTGLAAGTVVGAILDPASTQRIFNPVAEGNPVKTGDSYTEWLPTVKAVTYAQVTDNYWASIPGQSSETPNTDIGQIKLELAPAAANTVEASSVMTFYLSPQAIVLTVTGGTF